MGHVLWSNNAGTTLAFSISSSDTTATLASGTGSKFPLPALSGDYFTMTFSDSAFTMWEIVNVFTRVGDVITFARGAEGTTPLAWNAGDLAQNLLTAASLTSLFTQAVGGVLTGFLPNPGMAGGAAATNVGTLGGVLAGSLPNPGMAAGAASTNVGSLSGVLTGTLPSPGMAAGAAATNIGGLGGDLTGTLPSPSVAPAVLARMFAVVHDVTGLRSVGISYPNNTGRAMFVSIVAFSSGGALTLIINSVVIAQIISVDPASNSEVTTVSGIVPNAGSYFVSNGIGVQHWSETY